MQAGQTIKLISHLEDGVRRELGDVVVTVHNLPKGTVAAYYPEASVLNAIDHHNEMSKTRASKAIPVRVEV